MTAAIPAWVGYAALAASAVGAGVSAYGQHQAAKQSEQIAKYNYSLQMQQARQSQQMAMFQQDAMNQQAAVMEAQAGINNALAQAEAQARLNNAAALRQQADVQAKAGRENFRATQRDNQRLVAIQRARMAKSGTVESGSPLEILAETGGEMQMALNEQHYQDDIARRKTLGEAAMEEFGGKLASAGANAQAQAGRAEADFTRVAANLEGARGAAALSQGRREARIGLMTGQANAQGQRTAAWGSLISGVGNMAGQWSSWRNLSGGTGYNFASTNMTGGGRSIGTRPYGLT